MIKFLKSLPFIFRPKYWIMNDPYSKEWDKTLNDLMESHRFEDIDEFSAKIGPLRVWIANHPYASFTPYEKIFNRDLEVRPSRATIRKAHEKLMRELFEKARRELS